MTRNASPLGLAVQTAVRTTSSERNAAMFAQIASMILRGIREFDEAAKEQEDDGERPQGNLSEVIPSEDPPAAATSKKQHP